MVMLLVGPGLLVLATWQTRDCDWSAPQRLVRKEALWILAALLVVIVLLVAVLSSTF